MTNIVQFVTLSNAIFTFVFPPASSPHLLGYEVWIPQGNNVDYSLEFNRVRGYTMTTFSNMPSGNYQVNEVFDNGFIFTNAISLVDAAQATASTNVVSSQPIESALFTVAPQSSFVFTNWASTNYQLFGTTNLLDSSQYLYDWGYLVGLSNATDYVFSWQLLYTGTNGEGFSFTNTLGLPVKFFTNYPINQ